MDDGTSLLLPLILPSSPPLPPTTLKPPPTPPQTGDEALLDPAGYVQITGRIKDLIIRGGENIHPLEIENCLLAHPGVADVSVVGLEDERYGEVVTAFVVLSKLAGGGDVRGEGEGADARGGLQGPGGGKAGGAGGAGEGGSGARQGASGAREGARGVEGARTAGEGGSGAEVTEEDIRAWVRERLSHHLVPKYVFWTEGFPKTASGKVQKFRLREEGMRLLGRGDKGEEG